ncbi:hypothetical protein ACFSTC_20365 [Nonomuraea ferruginea]
MSTLPGIARDDLRGVMACFATGVAVITAAQPGLGRRWAWRSTRSCRCRWTRRWCCSAPRTPRPRG